MRSFMPWKECEASFVRKTSVDVEKAKSLMETSAKRREFLGTIKATKENASFIIEGCYEAAKELLSALLLIKGGRSSNHQCLISYFYLNYPEHEGMSHLLLQLNHARNRLNYYGELADPAFYDAKKDEIEGLLTVLEEAVSKAMREHERAKEEAP
jgi:uncharacterized protein (UPF0332 family)